MLGREVGLVAAAPITHGILSSAVREQFATSVADQRQLISVALGTLTGPQRAVYAQLYASPAHQRLAALEDKISASVGSRERLPVSLRAWQAASGAFLADMQKAEAAQAVPLAALEIDNGDSLLLRAVLAGGLGLVAVVASILLTVWFGRRLTGELTGLHDSAESIANERLPRLVERLRRGEEVDVAAESPPPSPGKITEIAKVAESFATVQRTAVEAAVGQANLRQGVNQVFLNLSLRNQSLLHRQLSMLDSMERATSNPAALEELFRLDHLTTRMRRHAEGLIILSGESPGRTWRHPVPLMDVLRAAVAEVEDYTRIRVESRTRAALAGQAVADVIHLIAELAENATVFSPPNTPVRILGDTVGRGFAVEIEDRGLGITEERLAEINRNLASPPVFDLSGSDRLGLFIAGQLARRHDISITLRPSPYGGTTAIVIIPLKLLVSEDAYERVPAIGADGRSLSAGGRHAVADTGENALGPLDDSMELPSGDPGDVWTPRPSVTALPSRTTGAQAGQQVTVSSPSGSMPPDEIPGLPTMPSPRQPASSGSVTPLPTAEEPGWWTKPSAAQPVMSDTGPGGEINGGAANGISARTNGNGADDPHAPQVSRADLGGYDLPVRVRQASLAPQLRDKSLAPDDVPAAEATPASAEAARNTMAALQRGWELGRSTADRPGDAAAADDNTADGADQ
jgi:signal transduction histidine kinase